MKDARCGRDMVSIPFGVESMMADSSTRASTSAKQFL